MVSRHLVRGGTGAIGLPWAPLPVVKTSTESPRVHLAAPLTLGGLSALLFAESAWLNVPLTQSFAVAALVMAGATLVPIDPLTEQTSARRAWLRRPVSSGAPFSWRSRSSRGRVDVYQTAERAESLN